MKLKDQNCEKLQADDVKLEAQSITLYLSELSEWEVSADKSKLKKTFQFQNFDEAIIFINRVAEIARAQNHHPDILLRDYKFVEIHLSTHDVGGLHKNDFIIAAKIDLI